MCVSLPFSSLLDVYTCWSSHRWSHPPVASRDLLFHVIRAHISGLWADLRDGDPGRGQTHTSDRKRRKGNRRGKALKGTDRERRRKRIYLHLETMLDRLELERERREHDVALLCKIFVHGRRYALNPTTHDATWQVRERSICSNMVWGIRPVKTRMSFIRLILKILFPLSISIFKLENPLYTLSIIQLKFLLWDCLIFAESFS